MDCFRNAVEGHIHALERGDEAPARYIDARLAVRRPHRAGFGECGGVGLLADWVLTKFGSSSAGDFDRIRPVKQGPSSGKRDQRGHCKYMHDQRVSLHVRTFLFIVVEKRNPH